MRVVNIKSQKINIIYHFHENEIHVKMQTFNIVTHASTANAIMLKYFLNDCM